MGLEATLGEAGSTATKACSVRADKLTRLSALPPGADPGPGEGQEPARQRQSDFRWWAPPKVPGSRERQTGVGVTGRHCCLFTLRTQSHKEMGKAGCGGSVSAQEYMICQNEALH